MDKAKDLNLVKEITRAAKRIGPHLLQTPLFQSVYLGELNHGDVYLKLESEQYTGSFKARGALNNPHSSTTTVHSCWLMQQCRQHFLPTLSLCGAVNTKFNPQRAV